MKSIKKTFSVLLIFSLSTTLWMLPLLVDRMGFIVDMKLHYQWAHAFQQSFSERNWIPRWNNFSHEGMGDATFSHIHPLFYYITTWLDIILNDLWKSMRWVVAFSHFSLGIILFKFCKKWAPFSSALAAGLIGQWIPFWTVQLLAMQQYPALLSLPFAAITLGLSVFARPQLSWVILASLALSATILSHILMGFMTIVCISLPILLTTTRNFLYPKNTNSKRETLSHLISWCFCVLFSILICSWYLLPAFFDRNLISSQGWNLGDTVNSTLNWRNNFSFSITEPYHDHSTKIFLLWLLPLPAIAISIAHIFWQFNNKKSEKLRSLQPWLHIFKYVIFSFFFSSALSWPFWYFSSTLQQLQFPWRFVGLMSLASAFLIAGPAFNRSKKGWRASYNILGIILITFPISIFYITNTLTTGESAKPNASWLVGEYGQPEYFPAGVPFTWRKEIDFINSCKIDSLNCITIKNQSHFKKWKVKHQAAHNQLLPVFSHPGWSLYVDGQKEKFQTNINTGLVEITLTPGIHEVEMRWQGTQWQKRGNQISLLTLLFIILFWIFLLIKPSIHKKNLSAYF